MDEASPCASSALPSPAATSAWPSESPYLNPESCTGLESPDCAALSAASACPFDGRAEVSFEGSDAACAPSPSSAPWPAFAAASAASSVTCSHEGTPPSDAASDAACAVCGTDGAASARPIAGRGIRPRQSAAASSAEKNLLPPPLFPSFRLAPCHLFSLSVSIAKPSPGAPKRRARKRYPHHIKAKSHLHPPPPKKKALRDQNRHGRHDGAGTWHVATPGRTEPREPTAHRGDQHRQRPGRAENAADWEFEASTMPGGRDRGVAAGRG